MCVDYEPPDEVRVMNDFKAEWARDVSRLAWPGEVWQDYAAPIIRAGAGGTRELAVGSYGMVPKRHLPPAVRFSTMNARSETVDQRSSFAKSWRNRQLCLVPMVGFFEPNWEGGKAVRWRISMVDHVAFAVAGLWREWAEPDGSKTLSFTQLTVNATDHPLMNRFHKPGDEKRSLIVVQREDYDTWLNCPSVELARSFLKTPPAGVLTAVPAPLGPRKKAVKADSSTQSTLI